MGKKIADDRALTAGLFAALTGIAAWAGYYRMFSRFAWYDDEGYLMISLKYFFNGFPLYDDVFTQYGPAYYLFRWIFHPLVAVTHDQGRLFSLAVWLVTALLVALFTHRETRSLAMAALAHLLTFGFLSVSTYEPGHPQEFCGLLLALSAVLSTFDRGARVFGVIAGLLLFTKINVGVLFVLSAGLLLPGRYRIPAAAAAVVLPAFLMRQRLESLWVVEFLVVATCSIVAVIVSIFRQQDPPQMSGRTALTFVAGLAATSVVVCLATLLLGSSPRGLLVGVLLQPLSFASRFAIPLPFTPLAFPLAAAGLGLSIFAGRSRSVVALMRVFFGLLVCLLAVAGPEGLLLGGWGDLMIIFAAPFFWLGVGGGKFARVFTVSVAVMQILQAYPMAGSQTAYGTFLLIPVALSCLRDGLVELLPIDRLRRAGHVALASVAIGCGWVALAAHRTYAANEPLGLPGAGRIRLARKDAELYRYLTGRLSERCDTFISAQGVNSLYFWTGIEPPTHLNTTVWAGLLTGEQQEQIIAGLKRRGRACALVRESDKTLANGKQSPLVAYIADSFREVERVGNYTIMVREGN